MVTASWSSNGGDRFAGRAERDRRRGGRRGRPAVIAADLVAQAEHDEMAGPVLISIRAAHPRGRGGGDQDSRGAPRRKIIRPRSRTAGGGADLKRCSVDRGRQHARLIPRQIRDARQYLQKIRNAGAVFIGPWSPVARGTIARAEPRPPDQRDGASPPARRHDLSSRAGRAGAEFFEARPTIETLAGVEGRGRTLHHRRKKPPGATRGSETPGRQGCVLRITARDTRAPPGTPQW